jgi:hypothetical protein
MTRQELSVFLHSWSCGCGSTEDAWERLRQILALHPLHKNRPAFKALIPDDGLQTLVLYFLAHLGLTEHGGSVGGGWLSEKGEAVLAALTVEANLDGFAALTENRCGHGYAVETDELLDCPECGPLNRKLKP